jgi:phosphoribosylamine--glycine ligase
LKNTIPQSIKILFISKWGEILDLAYAAQNEGNKVKLFISDSPSHEIGTGFVPKVRDWQKHIKWADLIVFDYTGYGKIASELRSEGKLVIGGTEYSDMLELDRSFGQDELKRHKIKTLPFEEFNTFHHAIEYVTAHPNSYVIKPSGEIQDLKQLLFVGKEDDGSDIIRVLKAYEKSWGDKMGIFQLQRKVKGVEISVSAFFNGSKFIKPINITFEHKKLFPKELGVSTGEMGTSMFWTNDNAIFDATLNKFEATFAKDKFVGHIDINCIVNSNGIYPLEFTSRFGYPQIQIQRAGILEPMGNFLYKIAKGENFKINTRKGFQVGAFIVVPPFPYQDKKTFNLFSKDAVVIVKKEMKEGVHPMHLKMINNEWLITGDSGVPLLISGTGLTMRDAQKMMYNRINNVIVNNGYYRTDIGDRWFEDSDKLWSWGLL